MESSEVSISLTYLFLSNETVDFHSKLANFVLKLVIKSSISGTSFELSPYITTWKVSKHGVFSAPCFAVFGLNTVVDGGNFNVQSKYRKIRTRANSIFGHFSCSVYYPEIKVQLAKTSSKSDYFSPVLKRQINFQSMCS